MVVRRSLAFAVVLGSACGALELSTTSKENVVVSNNPYVFPGSGQMTFVLSSDPNDPDDTNDTVESITLTNCNPPTDWNRFYPDPQGPPPGPTVCSVASIHMDAPLTQPCPHNYSFGIAFSPSGTGIESCEVTIQTQPTAGGLGSSVSLMLTGSGATAPTDSLYATSPVSFPNIPFNTTSTPPQVVTLKNTGTETMIVGGMLDGSGSGAFIVMPEAGFTLIGQTLMSGSAARYDVQCHPTVQPTYDATLDFEGAGSSGSASVSSMLSCTGINSTITIQPSQVVFPSTLVGRSPADQLVTITGGSATTLTAVALDGSAMMGGVTFVGSDGQGMSLGSTGVQITLHYDAAAAHASGPLGTLQITASSDTGPRGVGISGEALPGSLGTNPASIDFGPVCASGGTATQDLEVYASSAGDVLLDAPDMVASPFGYTTTDHFPLTLAGNHVGTSAILATSVALTDVGDVTGTLTLNSNVPNAPTYDVPMHAVGLGAGIAATPDPLQFGAIQIGTTSTGKAIVFSNCGATDLVVTDAMISGPDAGDFTIVSPQSAATTLHPADSETFLIVMSPHVAGAKQATLVIDHSAGMTTAAIDGIGLASNTDRQTYYACSTGHSTAAWPIGLALLALRRRRR